MGERVRRSDGSEMIPPPPVNDRDVTGSIVFVSHLLLLADRDIIGEDLRGIHLLLGVHGGDLIGLGGGCGDCGGSGHDILIVGGDPEDEMCCVFGLAWRNDSFEAVYRKYITYY
jgi:hypothetical protein